MSYITNRRQVERDVRKSMADMKKRLGKNIREVCFEIDDTIKAHTPVWSGKAVRNYLWSVGVASTQVFDAISNGPPGPTNSMALGTEPRRDVNESASRETLLSLDFSDPFKSFILTNNADDIEGLEYGLLPTRESSRSPNGMFGLTQNYISEFIRSKGILR